MLQIEITGIDTSTGGLILEENGHPNRGRSSPTKGEEVQWKVKNGSGVNYIEAITMKSIYGSDDVFAPNPPHARNAQKKIWQGTVNANSELYSVYVYTIKWVKDGDGTTHDFDPILSIRPTPPPIVIPVIVACVAVVTSVLYSIFLRRKYNSRLNINKK